jgi:hypothetical protein
MSPRPSALNVRAESGFPVTCKKNAGRVPSSTLRLAGVLIGDPQPRHHIGAVVLAPGDDRVGINIRLVASGRAKQVDSCRGLADRSMPARAMTSSKSTDEFDETELYVEVSVEEDVDAHGPDRRFDGFDEGYGFVAVHIVIFERMLNNCKSRSIDEGTMSRLAALSESGRNVEATWNP